MQVLHSSQRPPVASDECRHISQILPDVLARYGLSMSGSASPVVTELRVPVAGIVAQWNDATVDAPVLCPAMS